MKVTIIGMGEVGTYISNFLKCEVGDGGEFTIICVKTYDLHTVPTNSTKTLVICNGIVDLNCHRGVAFFTPSNPWRGLYVPESEEMEPLYQHLEGNKLKVTREADIMKPVWEKMMYNVFNFFQILYPYIPEKDCYEDFYCNRREMTKEEAQSKLFDAVDEMVLIAEFEGYPFSSVNNVALELLRWPNLQTSSYRDFINGRDVEVDSLLVEPYKVGVQHRLPSKLLCDWAVKVRHLKNYERPDDFVSILFN